MSNEKFKVKFGLAVGDTQATIDGATGNIVTTGNLQVDGNTILGSNNTDTVAVTGVVSGVIAFTNNSTTTNRGITGTVGTNDYWKYGGGATGVDGGFAEIATGDNGTEPIFVRQYSGASVANQLTLLDVSGNTSIPNNLATTGDIDVKGGTIQNSTGALEIASTGANNVVINPGSGTTVNDGHMILGQLNTLGILTTNGTSDLHLSTSGATAQIVLANGANGNITLAPNGTGTVVISKIDVASGEIDNTVIGANTAAAGTFTTATVTTGNITTLNATTVDTTNIEVTNIKARDGTAALTIADSTGVVTVSTQLQVDNINISTNTISSTDTNGNVIVAPNGTGIINLQKNVTADLGVSVARTLTGGGKSVDANGDVLIGNNTVNTTQQPVSAVFDNSTANRTARIILREYGQNLGNLATAATIGNAAINLEASRGTGTTPTSVNAANVSVSTISAGYYDGLRFSSENGFGSPIVRSYQNTEATASETSVFTASISITTMTVSAVASGAVHVGQLLTGTGVAVGTHITAYGPNTFGGAGTYTVSFGQTTSSTTITGVGTTAGGGRIIDLITPTGNKQSPATRQSMYLTGQAAPNTQVVNGVTVPQNASLNIITGNLEVGDTTFVNSAGTIVYKARGGGLFQIPTLSLVMAGLPFEDRCSFTGHIDDGAGATGNTLTVTAVISGVLYVGQRIYAVGLSNTTPYFITALGTGTGLTGTYTIASTFQTAGTLLGSSGTPVAMAGTPDDLRQAGSGSSITTLTSRKSTVTNRRAPLKNGDGIFSFNIGAQTGALGTGANQNVGNFNWTTSEDYSTSACGSQFFLRTVDIGTTNLNNRLRIDSGFGTITTGLLEISGDLKVIGNDIQSSTGATAISLSGADVAVAGDLTVTGNDIKSSSATAITLTGANVIAQGNLTLVSGTETINPPFNNNAPLTANATLLDTNTQAGGTVSITTKYKPSSGSATFTVPQANNSIGKFVFEASDNTAGTTSVLAGQMLCQAAEIFSPTANGTKYVFTANRQGQNWTTGSEIVLSMQPEQFTAKADAFTYASAANVDRFNVDSSRTKSYIPIEFPVYTIAGKPATGAVGQQISISDSPTSGGRMAFYDTTNNRWSYISDNSAV